MDNIIRNLESHRIPKDCLKEYKIEKGCELKKFMDGKFKSGVTYYQLTEKENIYEDKSLIFKVKNIIIIDNLKLLIRKIIYYYY